MTYEKIQEEIQQIKDTSASIVEASRKYDATNFAKVADPTHWLATFQTRCGSLIYLSSRLERNLKKLRDTYEKNKTQ